MAEEELENTDNDIAEIPADPMKNDSLYKKKQFLMIVIPILLVIGAAVGFYFSGVADDKPIKVDADFESVVGDELKEPDSEIVDTVFYDLEELVVNLNTKAANRGNLAKVKIALELESSKDFGKVESVMPRIIDTFLVYLRELRPEELEGAMGMYRLREEMLIRVNRALRPVKVYDIKFKQFEIQ